jgi:hypothetical protein
MKFLLTLIISIFFVTSCTNAKQEEVTTPDPALQKILDSFFKKYESSPSEAVDYIFNTNKTLPPQQTIELKDKLANAALLIGAFNGYEQIVSKSTTSSLILCSYLRS